MKEFVMNNSLNIVKKKYPEYNDEKMAIIKYGLEGIYLTITKTIIIFSIAFILGILKELIIFTLLYNIIRAPSFGMHANTSKACLISSLVIFITITYICKYIIIPIWLKAILGIIGIILMTKNSPADTKKKPIIDPKRRLIYKIISSILATLFVIFSLKVPNNFIANSFIFSLMIQNIMISKITYKLFKQPYDNYKNYQYE